ncbi:hypothetical protein FHS83_003793 [Rhizomicrobium palustre]|uniref:Beta-lactamase-inhibitor-like PepSY-like domain-containing protein n=1 Tax=Rhizomicrobium palustre TaxID=189966 RepID=A0A846N4S0_9PROT|nr:hypothetical protein [Rhizomicrobium palustre]NIK90475.1 hypothetical protein [Rhizomicrobium palustre]
MRPVFAGIMIAGALSMANVALADQAALMTPSQAIEKAADAAPSAVPGIFDLQVRSTWKQDGFVYLYSDVDYRDKSNLTIEISPVLAAALQTKYGMPPQEFFYGKHIHVRGAAQRKKITFFYHGHLIDRFFYQTHVELRDPASLELVP